MEVCCDRCVGAACRICSSNKGRDWIRHRYPGELSPGAIGCVAYECAPPESGMQELCKGSAIGQDDWGVHDFVK